jgi:hypothetical protein
MYRSHPTCNPAMSLRYLIKISLMQKRLLATAVHFLMVSFLSLLYCFLTVSAKHTNLPTVTPEVIFILELICFTTSKIIAKM